MRCDRLRGLHERAIDRSVQLITIFNFFISNLKSQMVSLPWFANLKTSLLKYFANSIDIS